MQRHSGSRLPTEGALAEHYQVSRPTLRKALARLEKSGYVRSRQGSGWYVTDGAPRLQGRTVAVVCEDVPGESQLFVDPRQTRQLVGIRRTLSEAGFNLSIHLVNPQMRETAGDWAKVKWSELLDFRSVCGLLVFWRFGHRRLHVLDTLREYAPLVASGIGSEPGRGEAGLDVASGVFQSFNHLSQLGHRRIAYLGNGPSSPLNQQRYTAIQLAMQTAGGDGPVRCPRYEPSEVTEAEGARLADRVLDDDEPVTAAHITARVLGEGFWRRAQERGLRVPDDLALVVEAEDAQPFQVLSADATQVVYDYEQLGDRSTELLMKIMADPRQMHHVDPVPTVLREGRTTAGPAGADAHASPEHGHRTDSA